MTFSEDLYLMIVYYIENEHQSEEDYLRINMMEADVIIIFLEIASDKKCIYLWK